MKKSIFIFLVITSSVFGQINIGWQKNLEISHEGKTRYFDVFIPNNFSHNKELVIQLHGGTLSKDELYDDNAGASKFWAELAEKEKFVLIIPNGTNLETGETKGSKLNWNDCRLQKANKFNSDDVGFISKLIDFAINKYQINNKKVFVTGVSNGGLMSYRLAAELPEKITAIAAFSANNFKEDECSYKNIAIPVMIVNGTKDKFIPFYGGITKYKSEEVYSSDQTLDFWLKNNKLSKNEFIKTNIFDSNKKDKSTIQLFEYGANTKSKISYFVVNGGGHIMAGKKYVLPKFAQLIVGKQNQDIEGAEIAWNFFKSISK